MRNTIFTLLMSSFLLMTTPCHAEQIIETISLHNRTSDEVIPALRPFLEPGGSLSGTGYKLIIKSSPRNIEEIKSFLADIDASLRQLIVSVASESEVRQYQLDQQSQLVIQDDNAEIQIGNRPSGRGGGSVAVDSDHIKFQTRQRQTTQSSSSPSVQQIRVTEGTWARLQSGQAVPIATRQRNPDGTITETVTYKSVISGFEILPRVNNQTVTITIRPQRESLSEHGGGVYNTQSLETTITGQLGQWMSLGGTSTTETSDNSATLSSTRQRASQHDALWVKIDLVNQ